MICSSCRRCSSSARQEIFDLGRFRAKGTEWWGRTISRTIRVRLSARMVFCAQRNAMLDRIPRSMYAKGRARGLLSIGWWLLLGGRALGREAPHQPSSNSQYLPPTARGRAWHLDPRSHALFFARLEGSVWAVSTRVMANAVWKIENKPKISRNAFATQTQRSLQL